MISSPYNLIQSATSMQTGFFFMEFQILERATGEYCEY